MSLKKKSTSTFIQIFLTLLVFGSSSLILTTTDLMTAFAQSEDSLRYPIKDPSTTNENYHNPFDITPSTINRQVEYDSEAGQYIVTETIGGVTYRYPTTLSFLDYVKYQDRNASQDYWNQKSNSQTLLQGRSIIPPLYTGDELLDRLFGGSGVDIRPTGNIDLTFGLQRQRVENPTANLRAQDPGASFLFDMGINMGVTGKIGDKLRLDSKYNTGPSLDFNNMPIKLEYIGDEDEIIQEIRAGAVNFPLPVTLIPGAQNLFGIQTKLKFGRLTVNTVLSQQKSRPRSITLENGGQIKPFEVSAYEYDNNRHYFLDEYFRDNFENAVKDAPYISSPITITRVDVYVSDSRGTPDDPQRDIAALADLGVVQPFNTNTTITTSNPDALPDNTVNSLNKLIETPRGNPARNLSQVISVLEDQYKQQDVRDFRQTRARRLDPAEYNFDPQLGFISINFRLNPNEIVGVAYEYLDAKTGENHQVGEFADEIITIDSLQNPNIVFLKMLKSSSLIPSHPLFDLMMKNVYAIGAYQLEQKDFKLDIFYESPNGGDLRYIPEGQNVRGQPLIQLLGLDRLNVANQPQSDGIFDFLPSTTTSATSPTNTTGNNNSGRGGRGGRGSAQNNSPLGNTNAYKYGTVLTRNGRIVFPVLEPFGEELREKFNPDELNLANKYAYDIIYDSTKTVALEYPEQNRFWLRGEYKETISSEIPLGAFNIPRGSVRVNAGGQVLVEGSDYSIDYNLGRVTILNDAYLQAGIPINISFEDSGAFGLQQKNYLGARLDYRINKDFNIGATAVRLSERPFTPKVNYGEDPIANGMVGLDMNYFKETPFLTKLVDKLPFYSTKEPSSITFNAELAGLLPGHARAINEQNNKGGSVYIDDFEGSNNTFDLRFPYNSWILASTPKGAVNQDNSVLFRESNLSDDLAYGFNRAKVAWYQIDNYFNGSINNSSLSPEVIAEARSGYYSRLVAQSEVFPNLQSNLGTGRSFNTTTFDLAYYPTEKGPYNYETESTPYSAGINPDGTLIDPASRWGGIMRACPYKDFEAANVEFIEFWMLDPFLYDENKDDDGYLYLQLGNISEDVLKDGKAFYENGLVASANLDSTSNWGVTPRIPPIINGFSNDLAERAIQDVGFDGLRSAEEQEKFADYTNYITQLASDPNATQETRDRLNLMVEDVSGDDFRFFRDDYYDSIDASILERYKNYNGGEGNAPVQTGSTNFTTASTNLPESEDLDGDRSLERAEAYLQYRIKLERAENMVVGENYLADYIDANFTENVNGGDNIVHDNRWYYFRVPVNEYTEKVGEVDLRNIEGMRLFLTDFEQPLVCRFARLNIVRSNWRRYKSVLKEEGEYLPNDNESDSFFNLSAAGIEQNSGSSNEGVPYKTPVGIEREQVFSAQTAYQLNEQSLALEVGQLKDGEARAAYKNIDMDMRVFNRLRMFIHAHSFPTTNCLDLEDGDVTAFIRIGDDFQNNYYEYELPLKVTTEEKALELSNSFTSSTDSAYIIWPQENEIDIDLKELVNLKLERNSKNRVDDRVSFTKPFTKLLDSTTVGQRSRRITVVGSPDLGRAKQVMLGIRNPKSNAKNAADDGFSKCATVWFNELRLSEFDEDAGWAGLASMDVKLADLGKVNVAGNFYTAGFGTIDQRVHERRRNNYTEYNASTNLQLGKFLPEKSGIRIPAYAGISQSINTPEYDPYNTDIDFKEQMDSIRSVTERIAPNAVDSTVKAERKSRQTRKTIKSVNFTNVRKERTNTERKPKPWDVENLDLTYAYTDTDISDPIIEKNKQIRHFGALGYQYNARPLDIYPFKKLIKSNSKYLKLIKDINFNPVPNKLGFQTDIERYKEQLLLRKLDAEKLNDVPIPSIWNKYLLWNRRYNFDYQPTKSISLNYTANNAAVIDELAGDPSEQANRDQFKKAFRDLGRTTMFDQSASLSYNLPLDKIPFLDWTTVRSTYGTTFKWQGNPVTSLDTGEEGIANRIGNNIYNTQNFQINSEFSFNKLYNKVPLFKKATGGRNSKQPRSRNRRGQQEAPKETTNSKKGELSAATKLLLQPLLMLKRVSLNYNDRRATTVPGYMPSTQYFGQNFDTNSPGLDFVFGYQPDDDWLDRAAQSDWITKSDELYDPVIQSQDKSLTMRARLEPFKDLSIDLTANLAYNKTNRKFFRPSEVVDKNTLAYRNFPLQDQGGFSISYVTFNTLYDDIDTSNISATFKRFEDYRSVISRRLQNEVNSNSQGDFQSDSITLNNYAYGYGPISHDVLAPAFVAAYAGKDPEKMNLNIFNHIPLPNWRINYNGLSKLPIFKKIFSSVNLTHGYNSTLNINNFSSDLDYIVNNNNPTVTNSGKLVDFIVGEELAIPTEINTTTGNYYTHYVIPNVSISEQFAPMAGVDLTWNNGLTTRFEYRTSRALGMNFFDYQLSENRSEEFVFGFGYNFKNGIKLPDFIKIGGKPVELQNELSFRMDASLRDDYTINHSLDQNLVQDVNGMKTIRIAPTIDYTISQKLRISLFYSYIRNLPRTTRSFPTTQQQGGLKVSFSL